MSSAESSKKYYFASDAFRAVQDYADQLKLVDKHGAPWTQSLALSVVGGTYPEAFDHIIDSLASGRITLDEYVAGMHELVDHYRIEAGKRRGLRIIEGTL